MILIEGNMRCPEIKAQPWSQDQDAKEKHVVCGQSSIFLFFGEEGVVLIIRCWIPGPAIYY